MRSSALPVLTDLDVRSVLADRTIRLGLTKFSHALGLAPFSAPPILAMAAELR